MPRRDRRAEQVLLIVSVLFGLGLAMQFRLGHDVPRQLSEREVELVADTVRYRMSGEPEDSIRDKIRSKVSEYNAAYRRDFAQSRIDIRLARSLESTYGPSDTTSPYLEGRGTAPMDSHLYRALPLLAFLFGIFLVARTRFTNVVSMQWKAIGLYGSLALCIVTFLYLGYVGGIRGSSVSPQELLKLTIPIAWAGILVRYRAVLTGDSLHQLTERPAVLWLYVLALLAMPMLVFVAVRDFGQFLAIGLAQVLVLAWFTRKSLYVILFGAGMLIAMVVLLGDVVAVGHPLFAMLMIVIVAGILFRLLERRNGGEGLWSSATLAVAGFGVLSWLVSILPFVNSVLDTPRSRFQLWMDLLNRRQDPAWWDNARQIVEGLYAVDAGGMFGNGIGMGSPFLIPKAASDFMFASIVEELGFVGGLLVILLLLSLVAGLLRIALDRGRRSFVGVLIAGYAMIIAAQSVVHVAGTMNLIPMTGITLPFVSSGMSSLVVSWFIVAVVLGYATRRSGRDHAEFVVRRDLVRSEA
jgi:cell division protein FtsW (lipid II flippase)